MLAALSLLGLLAAAPTVAQGPLLPPVEEPAWEVTDKGQTKPMDFSIPLRDMTGGGNATFASYAKKPLVIFYFSALCPHCQHAYPEVQALVDGYRARGLELIAVASGMNEDSDIRNFVRGDQVRYPMFKDQAKKFADAYSVGAVPLIVLVAPDGRFIRYRAFTDENKRFMNEQIEKMLPPAAAKAASAKPPVATAKK